MRTVSHRGFDPTPEKIELITLDGSAASSLEWEIGEVPSSVLWELDFGLRTLSPIPFASYRLAVQVFLEGVWSRFQEETVGVVLYKGAIPPFEMEEFAEYLHHLAALLPDEVFPFALFDCPGDPQLFSKEIFPHIHLGFRSGPIGVLRWGTDIETVSYDAPLGVALPLREKGVDVRPFLKHLDEAGCSYRLIAEPYITEEWDELEELIIFKDLISPWGMRMVQGFEAAGGKVIGVEGFEPPAFCSQSRRASQAALYPDRH